MAGQYQYLFTPIRIGQTIIPNCIAFSAHLTNLAEENLPGPRLTAYYVERARGGCGLIITEEQSVHPSDWAYQPLIHGFDPRVVPAYRRLTRAVHDYDTRIFAQINHNGMQASSIYSRRPVLGPSPLPDPIHREMCREIEPEEIAEIVRGYALVARHVREGGFDGAELQSSHSSLMRQFFSPYFNRRNDAYGGSHDESGLPAPQAGSLPPRQGANNRLRFVQETLEVVDAALGANRVLGVRLCADELAPWAGLTLEQSLEIARSLVATGRIDYLTITMGSIFSTHMFPFHASMHTPPGYAAHLAASIKAAVDVPVFAAGRIMNAAQAERILAEEQADGVEMIRALIADPRLPQLSQAGRMGDVRPCIACNQGCQVHSVMNVALSCTVNPDVVGSQGDVGALNDADLAPARGRATTRVPTPHSPTHAPTLAERGGTSIIIGGGPAGMEAAFTAALRGRHVILYEREATLGGTVALAARGPGRSELQLITDYLQANLEKLGEK